MIAWWRKGRPQTAAQDRPEPVQQLLRRLDWTVLRPIALRLGGNVRSVARGSGLDLAEIREYQPGDDVRHLDWSATARTGVPHVRQTYAERALDVWLLVDVSPSVDWGTARRTKRSHAQELVAAIAQVVGRHNNRVGGLLFAERPLNVLPPAVGRHHLLRLLSKLREAPRRTVRGRTDLVAALDLARTVIRRPSVVVLVSDLLVDDGWADALGKLAARHEVVVLRVVDPREGELPDVGIVTFEDPETGEQLVVDTASGRLRERFAAAARAQSERIERALATRGVRQIVASTDADLLPPLLDLLHHRRVVAANRQAAATFVQALPPSTRVGVIEFSTRARLASPLTRDRAVALSAIKGLDADGGTAIGDGLALALDVLQREAAGDRAVPPPGSGSGRAPATPSTTRATETTPGTVVLLSDGASSSGQPPQQAATRANQAGVTVHTVGIGERNSGARVGGRVPAELDERTLQEIARTTGGEYFYAAQAGDLERIYTNIGSRVSWTEERTEVTALASALGTFLLIVAGLFSLRWLHGLP